MIRLSFLFLICFSFFARAAIHCDWVDNGSGYTVTCTGSVALDESFEIPYGAGGSGGGDGGSCSNCTGITQAECERRKSVLLDIIADLDTFSVDITEAISAVKNNLEQILSDGNTFTYFSSISQVPGDTVQDVTAYLDQLSTSAYQSKVSNSVRMYTNNSVYKYYNQAVKPLLTSSINTLDALEEENGEIRDSLGQYYVATTALDCPSCQTTTVLPSGGGSGSSSSSSSCPCAEYFTALQNAATTSNNHLYEIRQKVNSMSVQVDSIQTNLAYIANFVHRLDDYLEETYKPQFEAIHDAVISLTQGQNKYWEDYTNATKMTSQYGTDIDWKSKGRQILTLNPEGYIDFGEYKQLNWFQRIEFLLGDIAGIFQPSNGPQEANFTQQHQQSIQSTKEAVDSAFSSSTLQAPRDVISTMFDTLSGVQNKINPFSSIQSYAPGRTLTLLPEVSVQSEMLGNTYPSIQLDLEESGNGMYSINSLVELCHTITKFVWSVLLLVIFVTAIWHFVISVIKIHHWYLKIYNSWFRTTFN